MDVHSIAGLKVGYSCLCDRLRRQSEAYLTEDQPTNFNIVLSREFLEEKNAESPHLTLEDCEYIYTGSFFYHHLVQFRGMLLHASAVILDGYAYLFSANSGTGKSTHTALWCEVFPEAKILNDDKPAIRILRDGIYVYGTPWSGKSDLNLNLSVPLRGICVLERSPDNFIEPLPADKAVYALLNQTLRPEDGRKMAALLSLVDEVTEKVRIWRMGCNISTDAARLAHDVMSQP